MNAVVSERGAPVLSGWHAALKLHYHRRAQRCVLQHEHQGPLLVQRPFYPEGDAVCHTYVLHPPAGVVGGDLLTIEVQVAPEAHALLTTPSATRFYRSAGPLACLQQHLRVAASGTVEWLPQENILFDGARAQIETAVDLADGARFFGWEIACLGRPANGECFGQGRADLRLAVNRDGRPLLRERLLLGPEDAATLRGHAATGTLLVTGADAGALAQARTLTNTDGLVGSSLLGDLLVCRMLAPEAGPIRAHFEQLWHTLRPLLLGRPGCAPRIWAT
jgi:urease accessory protein